MVTGTAPWTCFAAEMVARLARIAPGNRGPAFPGGGSGIRGAVRWHDLRGDVAALLGCMAGERTLAPHFHLLQRLRGSRAFRGGLAPPATLLRPALCLSPAGKERRRARRAARAGSRSTGLREFGRSGE